MVLGGAVDDSRFRSTDILVFGTGTLDVLALPSFLAGSEPNMVARQTAARDVFCDAVGTWHGFKLCYVLLPEQQRGQLSDACW